MEIGQQPMMQSPETKIQPSTKLVIKLGVNNIDLMLLDSSGHLINFFKNDFEEKLSPEKLLDKLDLIINESNIKFSNVIEVNLVILNKLSTLVPINLFDPKLILEYLKFNSKLKKDDYASKDVIEEIQAVNVFLPFVNINNYILEKFGTFNYYHYSTIIIKKLLKYNLTDETCFYANFQTNDFQIIIFKNKSLLYYNNFEIKKKEDILYYLLFVIEKNNLNYKKTKIILVGKIREHSKKYRFLKKFIKNVQIIKFHDNELEKIQNFDNKFDIDYLLI